ncbi:MAG: site-specific DNA-methyltransferase [Pseudomonadota bacterium]|nr:site-specific DNA-methyltransferase [Pseudomonadota bacterium]
MNREPSILIENGDCRKILPMMPADTAQMVITSPPYNIGKEYEKRTTLEKWAADQKEVIAEAARILREGGHACWQVGNHVSAGEVIPLDSIIIPAMREAGLKIRNRIVWTFGHGLHCRKRLSGRHETIIWGTKGDAYTFNLDPIRVPQKYPQKRYFKGPRKGELSGNPLGKNPGDVWDIPNVKHNHPEKTEHPCQFPEDLVSRLVLALTEPRDLIIDPYAGSGTTGVVAARHGRDAVLIEREASYIAIARDRLSLPISFQKGAAA